MGRRLIDADKLIELIDDDIASLDKNMPREGYDVCLCTLQMVKQYIKALQRSATNTEQFENCGTNDAEPKRDLEIVVNEACLNCELDCVEAVRCHDCKHYEYMTIVDKRVTALEAKMEEVEE